MVLIHRGEADTTRRSTCSGRVVVSMRPCRHPLRPKPRRTTHPRTPGVPRTVPDPASILRKAASLKGSGSVARVVAWLVDRRSLTNSTSQTQEQAWQRRGGRTGTVAGVAPAPAATAKVAVRKARTDLRVGVVVIETWLPDEARQARERARFIVSGRSGRRVADRRSWPRAPPRTRPCRRSPQDRAGSHRRSRWWPGRSGRSRSARPPRPSLRRQRPDPERFCDPVDGRDDFVRCRVDAEELLLDGSTPRPPLRRPRG